MRQLHHALFAVPAFFVAEAAWAQAAAPAAPGADTGGGASWLWILLVLLVIGAAAWYFFGYARKRPSTSHSAGIDHDRVAGSAEQMKGSVKEGVGSLIGDSKLQAEGRADKIEGKVQNTVGGVKDTLRGK
jgi:uncharacterized protein YjbJ (UPF0337 family)